MAEGVSQGNQAAEADRDEQRQPQPLDQPDGHVRQVAGQVERPHRDGVADRLIIQRAEVGQRVHQVPQAGVEPGRVEVHAELGVEEHAARSVGQQDDERAQPDQGTPAERQRVPRSSGPSR
jgi:hypothetical protein